MPSVDVEDTIAAIASASGPGLRGIIRLTGPDCVSCLQSTFLFRDEQALNQRHGPRVQSAAIPISESLNLPGTLLVWPSRRSYTRQPSAEFHTLGSDPLLKLALRKICQSGARLAAPGEFTLRAFLSGRLDLTQAEAVLAIIDAEAETQLEGALKQLAGGLSGPLIVARDQLMFVLAELEAGLDFVDEDIEFISQSDLQNRLEEIDHTLSHLNEQISSRHRDSERIRVALIGLPNAGKSSLFNRLLGSETAIVTQLEGTTTDFLSGPLELDGLKVELIDTAGLETIADTDDLRAAAQVQREFAESNSHLQLLCIDSSRPPRPWEQERLRNLPDSSIVVFTKADQRIQGSDQSTTFSSPAVFTSCFEGIGLDDLRNVIRTRACEQMDTDWVGATIMRAADSLQSAMQSVKRAQEAVLHQAGDEIVAAEIRTALEDLGAVVGTVYTDDILDIVFSRFCIGK